MKPGLSHINVPSFSHSLHTLACSAQTQYIEVQYLLTNELHLSKSDSHMFDVILHLDLFSCFVKHQTNMNSEGFVGRLDGKQSWKWLRKQTDTTHRVQTSNGLEVNVILQIVHWRFFQAIVSTPQNSQRHVTEKKCCGKIWWMDRQMHPDFALNCLARFAILIYSFPHQVLGKAKDILGNVW